MMFLVSGRAGAMDALDLMKASLGNPSTLEGPAPAPEATQSTSGTCTHGTLMPTNICEIGAGFLCLNTPPLSTIDEKVAIKGTIDVKDNSLTTLTVSVQNEYTNEYNQYKLSTPDTSSDCWDSTTGYCLDENGFYSATVPLGDKPGPYSISVTASRANGTSAEKKIRLSRVTAPKLSKEDIRLEIDPSGTNAQLTIDLLKSCPACDFFGVTTGGLEARVVNIIKDPSGGIKQVTEKTNMAGSGILSLCLTLGKGVNAITVSVCNAATGYDGAGCPTVNLEPFEAKGPTFGIDWLASPKPLYNADTDPEIKISFRLANVPAGTSCEESNVKMQFNREAEKLICADADGRFDLMLVPQTGINIGNIYSGGDTFPFGFAWGEIVSPFSGNATTRPDEDLWIGNAGAFSISQNFLKYTVRGALNDFLKSDQIKKLISGIGQKSPDTNDAGQAGAIRGLIPGCEKKAGNKGFDFKLYADPVVEGVEIPGLEFGQDLIKLQLNVKKLKIKVKVALDKGMDGIPEGYPMPYIIALEDLSVPVQVRVDRSGDKPLFIITSEYTDCKYKPGYACDHKPAVLIPQKFKGTATKGGALVKCDTDMDDACVTLNLKNTTGVLNTTVLDTINDMIYCDGSANLTYVFRELLKEVPIQIGCNTLPGYTKEPLVKIGTCSDKGVLANRGWVLPVGLDLLNNQFSVNEKGISGVVPAKVGSSGFFAGMPKELQAPATGFIRKPRLSANSDITSGTGDKDFLVAVHEDMINALLFVLTQQGTSGIFDWDIHEPMLKELGFDPVKECDEFTASPGNDSVPAVCHFIPRIGEILGSTITASGYFPQRHPIMIRTRGNRSIAPRIGFFKVGESQYADIQLGDIELAFYALEIDKNIPSDKHGNFTLKLDASGRPIILSMNPSDPDPDNGQIIRVLFSATVAVEISEVATDLDDPTKLAMTVRPDPALTKIIFKSIPGGNATVVPDRSLISAVEEKIKYGINIYSDPDKALKIKIPKDIDLSGGAAGSGDLFTALGLCKLSFGADGLGLNVEESQEFIDILLKIQKK